VSVPIRMSQAGPPSLALAGMALSSAARWRPGLAPASHSEIFSAGGEAAGAALALSLALDGMRAQGVGPGDPRMILWVQDRAALRLGGRPYRPGLPAELRGRVIHVAAKRPEDALFAMEEGLRCRDLACVIGELTGNPRALGLTASRRLSLAAERYGTPLFLVRLDAARDMSSARMRWQVRSAVSPPPRWNPAAPGTPGWRASLFRARAWQEGEWILHDDGRRLVAGSTPPATPDHGDLVHAAGDGSLASF